MPRFFVDPNQIKDDTIEITGQDVRHIRDVLRLAPNEEVTICDGRGTDYKGVITQVGQEVIMITTLEKAPSSSEPQTKLTLFQSLIKGDKFEWVIQKAIEIGVHEIIPMETAHCVVKIDNPKKTATKVARWNKIAESAAKQSGRGVIPVVLDPVPYARALELSSSMDISCMAYEKEMSTNLKSCLQMAKGKAVGVLVGPEGGFSEKEVLMAEKANVRCITLGPRILRSETASIVLVSNILYELGEMDL